MGSCTSMISLGCQFVGFFDFTESVVSRIACISTPMRILKSVICMCSLFIFCLFNFILKMFVNLSDSTLSVRKL